MSRENIARLLNRLKDDPRNDDERGEEQRRRNIRPVVHSSPLASSTILARSSPSFTALFPFFLHDRPTPWLRQMARIYFAARLASGFLLSPLCIVLVKHFYAFSSPFIPLFVPELGPTVFCRLPRQPLGAFPRSSSCMFLGPIRTWIVHRRHGSFVNA